MTTKNRFAGVLEEIPFFMGSLGFEIVNRVGA